MNFILNKLHNLSILEYIVYFGKGFLCVNQIYGHLHC